MGHVRLGRLPQTRRWRQVVELLEAAPEDVSAIASATTVAAELRLRELSNDPSLAYCFWVLTRIASASREETFHESLIELGIPAQHNDTVLSFIARVSEHVQGEFERHPASGPFAELASLAMRRAISETVGQEGRSLFGSSLEDLKEAFRRHSSPVRFGALAKSFFSDLAARTLRFFVEREVSNNVGAGYAMATVQSGAAFTDALDLHARESARIMDQFGRDWYSKHNWEARGRISRDEAQGFVGYAMRKLRGELVRSGT
jgi:hypothetical protein